MVLNRACGMKPPRMFPVLRRVATARRDCLIAVRARAVFGGDKCPAMRAHAARVHVLHSTTAVSRLACRAAAMQSATIEYPAMVKTEREHREDICQIGQLVFQKGWVAANDGNITIRLDSRAHPGHAHGRLQGHDAARRSDHRGHEGQQDCRPRGAHQRNRHAPDGLRDAARHQAVVHAHPPVATGFATAGRSLNLALLPEVVIGLGCVPAGRLRPAGHARPDRAHAAADPQVRRAA